MNQESYYRLIKPMNSEYLHKSSTLMGGASKCYKELKKVMPGVSTFSIMTHSNNPQVFDFDIRNKMQTGGAHQLVGGGNLSNTELMNLTNKIESLEKRVIELENRNNKEKNIEITAPMPGGGEELLLNKSHINSHSHRLNHDVAKRFI